MKTMNQRAVAFLAVMLAAGNALAHPGGVHTHLPSEGILHLLDHGDHALAVLAVCLLAVGLLLAVKVRRAAVRNSREIRSR